MAELKKMIVRGRFLIKQIGMIVAVLGYQGQVEAQISQGGRPYSFSSAVTDSIAIRTMAALVAEDELEAAPTRLVVYDILGREVVQLVDRQLEPGYHSVIWNGKTATGRDVPSGLYIALLTTATFSWSIKLVLLK